MLLSVTVADAQFAGTMTNPGIMPKDAKCTMLSKQIQRVAEPEKLPANQKYVGYYIGDELPDPQNGVGNALGFGMPVKVAIQMGEDLYRYNGCKIVGVRFGLFEALNSSRVFVMEAANTDIVEKVSQQVAQTTVGWNTVMLDEPYTIGMDEGMSLLVGYDCDAPQGKYPVAVMGEGRQGGFLAYGNVKKNDGNANV